MNLKLHRTTICENTISSGVFLSNIVHLFQTNDEVYMYSFLLLFISSILYHETYNTTFKKFDELCVYNIIYQGGYRTFIVNEYNILTIYSILCFLLVLYTYYYKLDTINDIRNHSILHIVTSVGHHIIIFNGSL